MRHRVRIERWCAALLSFGFEAQLDERTAYATAAEELSFRSLRLAVCCDVGAFSSVKLASLKVLTAAQDIPWAATVPSELLEIIGKQEVARQNEINELINGELEYVHDIDVMRTVRRRPTSARCPS